MPRVHNIGELTRRTGVPREVIGRFRRAGLLESVHASPLGRPLFASAAYAQIERIEQLRALGMSLDEVKEVIEHDGDAVMASPSSESTGGER